MLRHCQKQVRDSEEQIHGESLFQRDGEQVLKTLVSVLVLQLGADKGGPLLNYRFLLGVARWIRLTRWEGLPEKRVLQVEVCILN